MRMNILTRITKSVMAIGSMTDYDKDFVTACLKMAYEAGYEAGRDRALLRKRKGEK